MKRNRTKSSTPRLSREAERLVAVALGLAASGSRLEDRFWEKRLSEQVIRLLEHGTESALETALDLLYPTEAQAYDVLIDTAEAHSESLAVGDAELLLIAAPVLAWSKYSIPSGAMKPELVDALSRELAKLIAAAGTQLAVSPYLYSIDQLPQRFSATRQLARDLGQHALDGQRVAPSRGALPETAPLLADTRYVLAVLAAPLGGPLFAWQDWALERIEGHTSRAAALEKWRASCGPLLAGFLTGCTTELLLPDAYHVSCRESDRAVRPFGIRAAVAFLETALGVEAPRLRAVVAQFGAERGEECRIAFTLRGSNEVLHGVVWPLFGREEGPEADGPREQIELLLRDCRIEEVIQLDPLFPLEFCEDCGVPLFADPLGELVHPELPEDAEQPRAHLH